jgi:hypothetical protein
MVFEDKVITDGQAVQMNLSCTLDDESEVLTVVVMIIQGLDFRFSRRRGTKQPQYT